MFMMFMMFMIHEIQFLNPMIFCAMIFCPISRYPQVLSETKKALPMTPQTIAKLDLHNSNVTMVYEMSNMLYIWL